MAEGANKEKEPAEKRRRSMIQSDYITLLSGEFSPETGAGQGRH